MPHIRLWPEKLTHFLISYKTYSHKLGDSCVNIEAKALRICKYSSIRSLKNGRNSEAAYGLRTAGRGQKRGCTYRYIVLHKCPNYLYSSPRLPGSMISDVVGFRSSFHLKLNVVDEAGVATLGPIYTLQ